MWLIVSPAKTLHINLLTKRILVCSGVEQGGFMAGLLFPFLLILFATLYAFKTRKCPDGFNETRFILFTNCINTIHWLALVPLYLASTEQEIRAVILAYSLSLSAIVQLSCLVLPKLYTALFKPEKNTTKEVMKHHGYLPPSPPHSLRGGGRGPTRCLGHRASVPALHLQPTELATVDSQDSISWAGPASPRTRHPTWSHGHYLRCGAEEFRARSTSVSRSTQTTGSSTLLHEEEEDHEDIGDGLVLRIGGTDLL